MKNIIIYLILTLPSLSFADFGLLGNAQCTGSTPFPTVAADTAQANLTQVQELEASRKTIDAQMTQVSGEITTLQGYMKQYFASPWAETMQAHMDNGMDCCAPAGSTIVKTDSIAKK